MNARLIALPAAGFLLLAGFWNPPRTPPAYDSARWIDSGLDHERTGDFPAAERDFLEAAKIDHLFQPRWTLAGFYFRRNNTEQFWQWARKALAVGQRDLGALFDLCWQVSTDPEKIWSEVMPSRKSTWDEYVFYLMTTGKWAAARSTASRLAAVADSTDQTVLLNYCDLALAHGDKAGAITVWRTLCRRGLLPFAADRLLTNGDFRLSPQGHGFDWRAPASSGITSSFRSNEATFFLNGFQPEHAVLLEQPLALDPSAKYRLQFEYKTSGLDANSGIHWEAGDAASHSFAAPEWTHGNVEFRGDAGSLVLIYQRPQGATMAEGTLSLRRLDVAPQ
jgi:hypothetical protein